MISPAQPASSLAMRRDIPQEGAAADRLEAAFLEQMLKYMGPTGASDAGPGGEGESQFQSFLVAEHAKALASRLDLGLGTGDLA